MQDRYASFEFVLPQGVIHGDANIGNELHDKEGNLAVIDLDGFAGYPEGQKTARRSRLRRPYGLRRSVRVQAAKIGNPASQRLCGVAKRCGTGTN